jgi:hypothetical protein
MIFLIVIYRVQCKPNLKATIQIRLLEGDGENLDPDEGVRLSSIF